MHIDLFCSVIDNFGDAGVAWRLARGLADEGRASVRLWIDDPACLGRLVPGLDPRLPRQSVTGIEVRPWQALDGFHPGEVVIEAFGCRLPDAVLARMAERHPQPVWINLEYLTAEDWVEGYHRLPSPHPALPLQKHFFFPGFGPGTGGLLREPDLLGRRDAFLADPQARAAFDTALGVAPHDGLRVSLFCYPDSPVRALADAWRRASVPVHCLLPAPVAASCGRLIGLDATAIGSCVRAGALTIQVVPFLSQDDYDRLLWTCDLNFVRGEDSFVRAQWAARPLVWQAYRQAEGAHHDKVAAFHTRYFAEAPPDAASPMRALALWWNGMANAAADWPALLAQLPALTGHARHWSASLARQPDLVTQLAAFIESKLK